jgi:soluble lytic murein transglycosylase-like protein
MASTLTLRNVLISSLLLGAAASASAAFDCTDRWGHRYTLSQAPSQNAAGITCVATEEDVADAPEAQAGDVADAFSFGPGVPLAGSGSTAASRGSMVMITINAARSASNGSSTNILTSGAYDQAIEAAARTYGHDADLLRAIIHVESRGNPNAVSPVGAIGLMQVMPTTAAGLGLAEPRRALFDPEANIRTGAIYLRRLTNMFSGRMDLVVAAYNAGEGSVRRYKDTIPPFPETQAYVRDVMARYDGLRAARFDSLRASR